MKLKEGWVVDPKDDKPSVSLSLFALSVVTLLTVGLLNVFSLVSTIGPFSEFFYAASALYFGRRLNINKSGITADSDKKE